MKIFANELEPNQNVQSTFLVLNKEIRQKPGGSPYLSLTLGDKTGDVDAKMWDNVAEIMDTFDRSDFVKVRGQTIVHHNRLQLRVDRLSRVDEREVEPTDYFPASKRDRDQMYAELMQYVAAIRDPHLKALLEAFFADPDIARRYRTAPAAKSIHHAWIGGLIEHVLSLAALARVVAAHYEVDEDLLMTGVILHDIGKIYELTYERAIGYSDEGQLVGHILIGYRMLEEKVRMVPGFPPKLRLLVEHMIASHHGEIEYGSPKTPCFPEAMLLHHLDNLDAKMITVRGMVENDSAIDGHWTSYSTALDRSLLKKDRFLGTVPPLAPAPAPAPAPIVPLAPPAAAQSSSTPQPPKPQPKAANPPSNSLFASKLSSALKSEK
jgi:3'-5' exoribonuclease